MVTPQHTPTRLKNRWGFEPNMILTKWNHGEYYLANHNVGRRRLLGRKERISRWLSVMQGFTVERWMVTWQVEKGRISSIVRFHMDVVSAEVPLIRVSRGEGDDWAGTSWLRPQPRPRQDCLLTPQSRLTCYGACPERWMLMEGGGTEGMKGGRRRRAECGGQETAPHD